MKKPVIKGNFAFLYLRKGFYSENGVLSAINAYSDFLRVFRSDMGKYCVLKLEKIDDSYTLEELSNELLNYILGCEFEYFSKSRKDSKSLDAKWI